VISESVPVEFHEWLKHPAIPLLPSKVAVGWSGGADSTALLLALKFSGYDVVAWHVDHGWRESSRDESRMLAARAAQWDIPFVAARLEHAMGSNREAEARDGRYAQFLNWSRESGITTLCLGHQRDDQAETVCMRLLQGAAAAGCRGMAAERLFHGLRIVRPLLHVTGQALREVLKKGEFGWFEDPSNSDLTIFRNHIRQVLFPRMAEAGVAPEALFMRWQKQAVLLAKQLDIGADAVFAADQVVAGDQTTQVSLPWAQWADCSAPIRARVLQRLMASVLGEGVTPGRRHIVMVEQWTSRNGRGGLDLSGCRLQRRRGDLHLLPTAAACGQS